MFKGIGDLSKLGQMMSQAQEVGARIQEMQEQLKHQRATGSAGGGMVEVDVTGDGEVLAVRIEPSLYEKQDREMLEDLLPAAFNDARAKAKQLHAEAMQQAAGGLDLPGLGDAMSKFTGDS